MSLLLFLDQADLAEEEEEDVAELRKYGETADLYFSLRATEQTDFLTTASFVAGDVKIRKDGVAFTNVANLPTHAGNGIYRLVLAATELQAALIEITIIDQDTEKVWEDRSIRVETYGNASAQHAFDLDSATVSLGSGAVTAGSVSTDAANKIADHILRRAFASSRLSPDGDSVAFRSLLGAVAKLVNRIRVNVGNLEIFNETDTGIPLGKQAISSSASADPITGLDTE